MTTHELVARAFVAGEPVKKSWLSRVRGSNGGWGGGRGSGPSCHADTIRLSVSSQGGATVLRSYERMDLAVRDTFGTGKPFILINGDRGPSASTRGHQGELFAAAKAHEHGYLPFSAALAARVNPAWIRVIATTPAREIPYTRKRKDGSTYEGTHHFLGELLFEHAGRLYVSGLDRNEPGRRNFYLARLPVGCVPKTVDQALRMLRPKGVPEGALRQGEYFFVPAPKVAPKRRDVVSTYTAPPSWRTDNKPARRLGVPLVSAVASVLKEAVARPEMLEERRGRHAASRVYMNGSVYVAGLIRDTEHGPLRLPDGWFRVVRNAADGAWGATGDVD